MLADADGQKATVDALVDGGRASPTLTRTRLGLESAERSAQPARVVVVPDGVRVWTDDATALEAP